MGINYSCTLTAHKGHDPCVHMLILFLLGTKLLQSVDRFKDQTYFLAQISQVIDILTIAGTYGKCILKFHPLSTSHTVCITKNPISHWPLDKARGEENCS